MAHLASTLKIPETLFTTNQAPSEEDSKAIVAKLAQLREEHILLAVRLAEIETAIPQLEAIQSPIRHIPDDVLGRIFEYATPWCLADSAAGDSFPPSPLRLGAPWTLSHVCRNWMAVCLSLPHLWSTFHVLSSDDSWWVERLDTLYRRSEPLPLRLYVDYISRGGLPTLLKAAHRWRCVRLTTYWGTVRDHNLFHGRLFPHLTHLSLYGMKRCQESKKVLAPCLQSLELVDVRGRERCLLPWDQITRYKSTGTDHEIIGRMENLEEIIIKEDSSSRQWGNLVIRGVVPMKSVRRLEYIEINARQTGRGGCFTHLFLHFQFTSLRTLVIDDAFSDDGEFGVSLPSVIELSLSFHKPYNIIRDILLATPNVQSLHLQSDAGTVSLLRNRYTMPRDAPVGHLRQLRNLLFTLDAESWCMDIPTLSRAITNLKVNYELPLEMISFYSGILDEEETLMPESQWVEKIQQGIADEVEKWRERGMQVRYHHNVEHRFA